MRATMDAPRMPERMANLLARIRREARSWIWIESLGLTAVILVAAIALTLVIDWFIEPPAWARATLAAAVVVGLLWFLGTRLVARLMTPLADRSLALAVERRHPELGDTFSTAVDLAATEPRDLDPDLVSRTEQAAESLLHAVRPARLFRRRRLLGIASLGLVAVGLVAGAAGARPDIATMWTRRMVLLDDTPWPRRVAFVALGFHDNTVTVARGSDVEVITRASVTSGTVPDLVELRIQGRDGTRMARMGMRGSADATGQLFAHTIEDVSDDLDLEIRGGDGRLRDLRVIVVDPPTLAGATIRYRLPEYLGGGERAPPFSRTVPIPRGSQVDVTLTTSKPFTTAQLAGRFAAAAGAEGLSDTILAEVAQGSAPTNTISATIPSLDADGTLVLTLVDTDGIAPREPFVVSLTAVPDEPPTVAMRLFDIAGAVTPKARVPVIGTLADDYGLAEASVSISRGDDAWQHPLARVRGGAPLVEITAEAAEIVPLEPLGLRPGDRLTLSVTARDTCGLAATPNMTQGDTWTLDVVTPEALQAALEAREILLRRRLEAAIDDLKLARRSLDEIQPSASDAFPRAAGRLGEAAARGVGEAGEIAAAFRSIRNEFDANGLLTTELETRLLIHVADPLATLAANGLAGLAPACRAAAAGEMDLRSLAVTADASIKAIEAVLARLLELESFNEVVEKLRGIIRTQEQIRAETLEQQRKRARQALEGL